ncbi:nucleotide-sugar transporter [Zalerion maritima]|uniref:Nucleotide-sugar transporter n=1 Tax=Zalerion maritima TaxID=339359 RepID=A0AAD5RWI2_9PEZI|nr:nucleotide-sugar transporter [Zalerion maritima]
MGIFDVGSKGGATFFGLPAKPVSLLTLTIQNSALMLLMHYSRVMPPSGDHRYFTSTAVFLNELLKLSFSLTLCIYEASRLLAPSTPATVLFQQIYNNVFSSDSWKLAIPAALYTVQNLLQYVAVSNLDAVHFQVLYQLKILTTAIFSVVLLRRPLGPKRWLALVILTIGVAIVSLPPDDSINKLLFHDMSDHFFPRSMHELGTVAMDIPDVARELTKRGFEGVKEIVKRSATYQGIQEDFDSSLAMNYSLGVLAVVGSAMLSGLTGVYFEKVLKDPSAPVSVWTRNVQLSLFSLLPSFVLILAYDGADIAEHGFFDGYNIVVWTTVIFQAAGGILVSLVLNYADNILKNFATSISILISFVCSIVIFEFEATFSFLVGMVLVLGATFLYGNPERKRTRPPPISIGSFERRVGGGSGTTPFSETPSTGKYLSVEPLQAVSTSRPSSPNPIRHHSRVHSARGKKFDE